MGLNLSSVFVIVIAALIAATAGVTLKARDIFVGDEIVVKKPLVPKVRITTIDGISDTAYIYKRPK